MIAERVIRGFDTIDPQRQTIAGLDYVERCTELAAYRSQVGRRCAFERWTADLSANQVTTRPRPNNSALTVAVRGVDETPIRWLFRPEARSKQIDSLFDHRSLLAFRFFTLFD
jgi:hypothetical protein